MSDRVHMRHWREDDAEVVYEACQDPEIVRWIPAIPRPYTREDAVAFVTGQVGLGPHHFAIVEDERVAGAIGLKMEEHATARIGYWVAAHARGRGLATEALHWLCRYALDELGAARLELITDPDNLASQRVATKAGFQREGVLRSHLPHPDGRRRDSVMFSRLPGDPA
jgi:RimJ/RimL family protein N-acetyltransferase